ncbi:MAG: condensation domain-containing protein [Gordonia sp. (in: high G+C Gram-positive bacteria)]|uniref:condensation domain-containing protein n=1 Tax=Gordonia sp. (in: high G+C Gram-positive bacteria) TaxID=84139 RepID=UPI003BB54FAB
MEFLQVLDAPVEPGGLIEWIPAVPGGLGAWHRDPRATSHNHEQHLQDAHAYRLATHRQGGREAWLGLTVEFDEQISQSAVQSAILGWINRHEVLRTHVTFTPGSQVSTERYTADAGTVHLRRRRIGWFADPHQLIAQIGASFDGATAPLHWPAYRFATVARACSFTLLFAADHSLVDGYSLVNAQFELREMYRAALERRDPTLPATGSYVDFSDTERRAADTADDWHTAAVEWREFTEGWRTLPGFALLERAGPLDAGAPLLPQSAYDALLLDDEATCVLEQRCGDLGGSLIGGLLTTAALVYREQTGADRFATVMPRHTRNQAAVHSALGWFVALAPVSVEVSDDPSFPTALERMMVSLDRAREGASLPLLRLAELLDFVPEPKFVVSFMDTRAVPGAAHADAGGARALRSHSYADDEFYVWFNRTPHGLRVHARFPADRPGRPVAAGLRRFLSAFTELLASIVAARQTDR